MLTLMLTLMLIPALALAQRPAQAESAPGLAPTACTLVYGHGRNVSAEAPRANALWNELNLAFNQAMAAELGAGGRRTVALLRPVEARDLQDNANRALGRALAEGCDELVETSVFGDADTELLIVRLRAHPIQRPPGAPRITSDLVIGPASATVQRELPLIPRSLQRLGSGELARQMTSELRVRPLP